MIRNNSTQAKLGIKSEYLLPSGDISWSYSSTALPTYDAYRHQLAMTFDNPAFIDQEVSTLPVLIEQIGAPTSLVSVDELGSIWENTQRHFHRLGYITFDMDAISPTEISLPNSTDPLQNFSRLIKPDLSNDLVDVFKLAKGEDFEDGVETEFSRRLENFIEKYGHQGIETIQSAYDQQKFSEQYIAEALLWIGDMEHDSTRDQRRNLLENALASESVFIRDAAVTGLSYLGDPKSIERLSAMLEKESAKGVRTNIEGVLEYLHRIQSDSFYDEASPLDKVLGIFDDDITDMSTSVRDIMDKFYRKKYESTD